MNNLQELGLPILMLFMGIVTHIFKKIIERRQQDMTFNLKRYLVSYPYQTTVVVFMAVGGFFGMHAAGVSDLSAYFLMGVTANSFGDAAPGSR